MSWKLVSALVSDVFIQVFMVLLQWVGSLCQPLYPLCIRCLHPSLHATITVSWKLVSVFFIQVFMVLLQWVGSLCHPLVSVVFIQVFMLLLQWVGSLCQPLYPLSSSKSSCYYYSELEACVSPCIRCLHPSLHATITVSWKLVSALVSVVFIQVFMVLLQWVGSLCQPLYPFSSSKSSCYYYSELKLVSALVSVVFIQVFMLLLQWVGSLCQPLYPLSSSKSSWYYYSELEACVSPCIRCLHPNLHGTITVSWKLESVLVSTVFTQVFMALLQWVGSLCQPLYPLSSPKSSWYYYSELEACVSPCTRCLHPSLHGTITVSWKLVSALVPVVSIQVFMVLLQWVGSLCQPLYPLSPSKSSWHYYSELEACVSPCIRCLHPNLHGAITVSWKLVSALVPVVSIQVFMVLLQWVGSLCQPLYPLSPSKSSWYYYSELEACVSPCIRCLHPSLHATITVS